MTYQAEQVGPDAFRPTGRFSTETQGDKVGFNPFNIYNCYAAALSTPSLKDMMLNANVARILLTYNEQYCLEVGVVLEKSFTFDFSKAVESRQEQARLQELFGKLSFDADESSDEEEVARPRPFK